MAVTEQRALFNPQIESLAEQYAKSMGTQAAKPFTGADITAMAPQVAGQTTLQQRATTDAQAGLGAYQPYVGRAGAAGTAAGTALGQAGTALTGAQTGIGGLGQQYAAPAITGLQGAQATLAGAPGVSGVQDYIGAAGTGLAGAAGTLGTAGTQLGAAQTAMAPVSGYVSGAAGLTGTGANLAAAGAAPTAGSIEDYMSPYQQQVIDTSLAEFDRQAAMRQQGISDAAVGMGGYGGGREGVMQSEYQLGSDRNRALLEAQMQQQGYGQAQAARQADLASRLGIGGAQQQYASGLAGMAGARAGLAGQEAQFAQGQLGLGQATGALAGQQAGMAGQRAGLGQQQLGLGQYQMGIGQALQGMAGQDISTLGRVGAADQAQLQAEDAAKREANRMMMYEPMERMGYIGSGLSGLMQGMGPQYQFGTQPNASPLATALGIGTTLGGIYGNVIGPQNPQFTGSDVRLKTDIEPIGKSSSGVNVYSFKYKGDDKTYQGVMAQEVPWASIKGNDGYLKVDYSKVDVEFKRLN